MSKIVSILEDIKPGIDYENCKELIDGHYLDSLSPYRRLKSCPQTSIP